MADMFDHYWQIIPYHCTEVSPNLTQKLTALDLQHDRHQNGATDKEIDTFIATHLPMIVHMKLIMPVYVANENMKPKITLWLNWKIPSLPDAALTLSYRCDLHQLKKLIAYQSASNLWFPIFQEMAQAAKQIALANLGHGYNQVNFNDQITIMDLPIAMQAKAQERMEWMSLLADCPDNFSNSNGNNFGVAVSPTNTRHLAISLSATVALGYSGDLAFTTTECVGHWFKNRMVILLCYYESMNEDFASALHCLDEWQAYQIKIQNAQKSYSADVKKLGNERRAFYERKIGEAFAL